MPDTAEWDHKVFAAQELLLQIVTLFTARVYLLKWGKSGVGDEVVGQKGEVTRQNGYLSGKSARRLESCFGLACILQVMGG